MSESNAMPIPEDLEFEYDSLKECAKHGRLTYQFNVEGMCGLIERIGRAEQRVQELEAALRGHDALLDAVNSVLQAKDILRSDGQRYTGSLLDKSVAKATARVRALLSQEAQPKEEA